MNRKKKYSEINRALRTEYWRKTWQEQRDCKDSMERFKVSLNGARDALADMRILTFNDDQTAVKHG